MTSVAFKNSRISSVSNLGNLSYFLGLEIAHFTDGLYITQAKYAFELLSRVGLIDSKTVDTQIESLEGGGEIIV